MPTNIMLYECGHHPLHILRIDQQSLGQMMISNIQSADLLLLMWLPFLINRVLRLTKQRLERSIDR